MPSLIHLPCACDFRRCCITVWEQIATGLSFELRYGRVLRWRNAACKLKGTIASQVPSGRRFQIVLIFSSSTLRSRRGPNSAPCEKLTAGTRRICTQHCYTTSGTILGGTSLSSRIRIEERGRDIAFSWGPKSTSYPCTDLTCETQVTIGDWSGINGEPFPNLNP